MTAIFESLERIREEHATAKYYPPTIRFTKRTFVTSENVVELYNIFLIMIN